MSIHLEGCKRYPTGYLCMKDCPVSIEEVREELHIVTNEPTNTFKCKDCDETCERYRGEYEVCCPKCGASHNAGGQRLRDDWASNPSNYNSEIGDLEGFEIQHAGD